MNNKIIKAIIFVLILIFYGSFLLHKIELPAGDDIARHIKNGELILHGQSDILHSNVYSSTEPNHVFINHHWMSGVIFYLLFQVVGWSGLVIFKIIILLITLALLLWVAIKNSNFWLVALFSIPTILILGERTTLRPEIFSYLFTVIFIFLLIDLEEHPDRKRIFWLILLQLLWVNMHLFFIIGIALVAGFLFEKIILNRKKLLGNPMIRKLAVLLIAVIVISFFNPNGISGVAHPFQIFNNYGSSISENFPPSYFLSLRPPLKNISIIVFQMSALFLALSFLVNLRKKPIFYFLVSTVTIIGGFVMLRLLSLFGFIFLPTVSSNFSKSFDWIKNIFKKNPASIQNFKIVFVSLLILSLGGFIYLESMGKFSSYKKPGFGLTAMSNSSAVFFKDQNLKGPIFNDYDIGSYLIYHLYPQEKVFVDNRPEAYSPSFFKDIYYPMLQDENMWEKMLEKYRFNAIFIYQYDETAGLRQFIYNRIHDPFWRLVYADTYAMILLKNNSKNKNIIEKFQITSENAEEKLRFLSESESYSDQVAAADIFKYLERSDLGRKTFLQVVEKWPENGRIWMVMGEWESKKNPSLAITYLEKAIAVGHKTAEAYSFLGEAYIRTGQYEKAKVVLTKALKINPNRQDTKKLLESIRF